MTLGFPFEPWTDPDAIADGPKILDYLRATAEKHGIAERIRFGPQGRRGRVVDATSATLDGDRRDGEGACEHTCGFLYLCSGYYDYERRHDAGLPGQGVLRGWVVHPQLWPDDLDVTGSQGRRHRHRAPRRSPSCPRSPSGAPT